MYDADHNDFRSQRDGRQRPSPSAEVDQRREVICDHQNEIVAAVPSTQFFISSESTSTFEVSALAGKGLCPLLKWITGEVN